MPTAQAPIEAFHWEPQPKAQALVAGELAGFLARCPGAAALAAAMKTDTGTRMIDWLDHLGLPASAGIEDRLGEAGFERTPLPGAPGCWSNDKGLFPQVVIYGTGGTGGTGVAAGTGQAVRVAIKVESVVDFLAAQGVEAEVEGDPGAPMRRARVFADDGAELWAIERHGYRSYSTPPPDPVDAVMAARHLEKFRTRGRDHATDAGGLSHTDALVDAAVGDLGRDRACDLFFAAEREYWMRRNRAGRVQKARQDRLGLGWANHDHHTYRCSREHFVALIALWEKLGFVPRERFYAGAEAGWGAQVMEQHATGITTFNDVDMSPEELRGDFARTPLLAPRDRLGTVGLWCGLHGEAVLQAGMHHLEAMFDWHALADQLEEHEGVRTMAPFTTFPYLRQAFTEGERWAVPEARLGTLLERGLISPEQAAQFRAQGALGSHLENLERNDGFKGFNQAGVSDIIAKTDPRRQVLPALQHA